MSWYRQYRPTTIHQLHLVSIRQTLEKMMETGSFPHAFLFAGPKGTGKTSSARIIAALLNDPANAKAVETYFLAIKPHSQAGKKVFAEPDQQNDLVQRIQRGASYVVTELDAASNRGIDDIRQLKERIFLPPQEGKVSVYILDEAHMLTTEAFNALLKILEEPPAHVVFILATTELHKIPETIVSRCALLRFHKASSAELKAAMEQILVAEKITFEPAVLDQLAEMAEGSFRDAVKLLEMVAAGRAQIKAADVQSTLQNPPQAQIQKLLAMIIAKDEKQVVNFFAELRTAGSDPKFFTAQLITYLHQQLLIAIREGDLAAHFSAKISHYLLTQFTTAANEPTGMIPFLNLELKSLEMIFKSKDKSGRGEKKILPPKNSNITEAPSEMSPEPEALLSSPRDPIIDAVLPYKEVMVSLPIEAKQLIEKWDEFLAMVRQKNSSVEALLRSSKPVGWDGEKAQVEVYYQFHREQLQQPKFRLLLDECVEALFGGRVAFEFLLAESSKRGAKLSSISGKVDEEDTLIQLAKEILV